MQQINPLLIILLIPLLLLTSCTKQISINTYADKSSIPYGFPHHASFYIFTKPEDRSFLARETTHKITHILQDKGYRSSNKHTANYYLFFTYDMQSEKHTIQVPMKVTEQIITKESNVPKDINAQSPNAHVNEQVVSSQLIYVPEERTIFNKTLLIQIFDADDYRQNPQANPLWESEAYLFDETNDLRDSLDYLLITALKYFGKNTKKLLSLSINNNDKHVKKLRKSF